MGLSFLRKRTISLIVLFFFTMTALPVFASDPVIKEIEFVGNSRTPTETLKDNIALRREMRLDEALVDRDIKSIYKLGQFQDVRAEVDDVSGGVKLKYILTEKPVIAKIKFEGNKKIKADDLMESVTQRTFSVLDEKAVAESIDKMKAAYAKKGFYLVQIDYRTEPSNDEQSNLIFEISEHQGVAVRKVLFIGNKVFDDWLFTESQRIVAEYGNHPSFLLFASGNEPDGRD